MYETLKMMKSILNGKEGKVNEKELIKEYQEKLSPNILAYFYVNNFGLVLQISKKYPLLLSEDIASFCLQELDLSLQSYDLNCNNKFITYFAKRFKNLLRTKMEELNLQKNKANILCDEFSDNLITNLEIENTDLLLNEYKLNSEEKFHSKLILAGYTIKEIAKLYKITTRKVYYMNAKLRQKILKQIVNF